MNTLRENLNLAIENAEITLAEIETQTGIKAKRINAFLQSSGELSIEEYEKIMKLTGNKPLFMPHNTFGNVQSGSENKYIQIVIMDKTNPAIVEMLNSLIQKN